MSSRQSDPIARCVIVGPVAVEMIGCLEDARVALAERTADGAAGSGNEPRAAALVERIDRLLAVQARIAADAAVTLSAAAAPRVGTSARPKTSAVTGLIESGKAAAGLVMLVGVVAATVIANVMRGQRYDLGLEDL